MGVNERLHSMAMYRFTTTKLYVHVVDIRVNTTKQAVYIGKIGAVTARTAVVDDRGAGGGTSSARQRGKTLIVDGFFCSGSRLWRKRW